MEQWEEFYKLYYPQIYAYCLTLARDRADAEDITQETFYRAIVHINSFRGDCKMSVWLCSIAKNIFLSEQKKRRRKPKPQPPREIPDIEDKDSAREILQLANALDEPYRGVFLLRASGGWSYEDIMQLYKKSASWARVTYYRAKKMITDKLEEQNEKD